EPLRRDESLVHQGPLQLGEHGKDPSERRQPHPEEDPKELEDPHRTNSRTSATGIDTPSTANSEAPERTAVATAASSTPRTTRTRVDAGAPGSAVLTSPGNRRQRKSSSSTMPATAIPRSGACTQGRSSARTPDSATASSEPGRHRQ